MTGDGAQLDVAILGVAAQHGEGLLLVEVEALHEHPLREADRVPAVDGVAQLGLGDVRFPHPLFAGDTLYTETEITEVRLSRSRPGQGIVTMAHTGRNQNDDIVAQATRTALMWCRPDATAAGSPEASVSPAASASHAPRAPHAPQSPMEDA